MYSFHLLTLIFFGGTFILNYTGAEENKLRAVFENVKGDLAVTRDYCLKDSSITMDDLKTYEDDDLVPENLACFFKCLYKQTEIIDSHGNMNVDALEIFPGFDNSKFGEVKKCVDGIPKIMTCIDMKRAGKCLHLAVAL